MAAAANDPKFAKRAGIDQKVARVRLTKSKRRKRYDWEKIEQEYRAGQLSLQEISDAFGPAKSTIHARAGRYGWERDLSAKVSKAAKAQIARDEERAANADANGLTESEREIVDQAAARVVQIVREHRGSLKRVHGVTQKLLAAVEAYAEVAETHAKTQSVRRRRDLETQMKDIRGQFGESIVATLDKLSRTLERVVRMEREAFNVDDNRNDGAEDGMPLPERLKMYQREAAMQEAENVTELRRSGT